MEDFNLMAKGYDTDKRAERAKIIADEIRCHVHNGQEKTALEFGCGTGLVGLNLADDFKSLLFVDAFSAMVEQVQQKLRDMGKPVGDAICCNFITDVPRNIKVDYIFSSLVLHHIKDTKSILSRLYQVLNQGGHLLIVDINADDGSFHAKYPDFDGHNGFSRLKIMGLAKTAGFNNVSMKTFYYGSKTVNGEEKPYSLFILDAKK